MMGNPRLRLSTWDSMGTSGRWTNRIHSIRRGDTCEPRERCQHLSGSDLEHAVPFYLNPRDLAPGREYVSRHESGSSMDQELPVQVGADENDWMIG